MSRLPLTGPRLLSSLLLIPRRAPAALRNPLRTYTIRDVRGSGARTTLVVDMVLHLEGDLVGPGSLWASRARVGDRIALLAPRRGFPYGGIEFTPGPGAELLLVGDETAVPAVCTVLEQLPGDLADRFLFLGEGEVHRVPAIYSAAGRNWCSTSSPSLKAS